MCANNLRPSGYVLEGFSSLSGSVRRALISTGMNRVWQSSVRLQTMIVALRWTHQHVGKVGFNHLRDASTRLMFGITRKRFHRHLVEVVPETRLN